MTEEANHLQTISSYISDPVTLTTKRKGKKKGKKKFDIPSREVLALTGTTYPMLPVRTAKAPKVRSDLFTRVEREKAGLEVGLPSSKATRGQEKELK
jgi:hypothetical protein